MAPPRARRQPSERVPPHDLDTEEALLGAAMLSPGAIITALDAHISPDDFYKPQHAIIWRGILDLFGDEQPIDLTTLAAHLRHQGQIDEIGGRQALAEIQANTPASANAGSYARTVHQAGSERKLLKLAGELEAAVYAGEPTFGILEALTHPVTTDAHGWAPTDLRPLIGTNLAPPEPTIGARHDGRCLIYPGRIHSINGASESLKSWLALHATAQEIRKGNEVLFLDFEDTPESILGRLLGLGVPDDDLLAGFTYIRPDAKFELAAGAHLERLITKRQPTLVVIDGVTEAMSLEGLDLIDNNDVATWLNRLPRRIKNLGPAVVLIDHVTKNGENRPRGAIGGQHKLAGVDVSYLLESITPLAHVAPGMSDPITGTTRITVEKDRPGGVRAFAAARKRIGDLHVTAYPDGGVTVTIQPAEETPEGGFRPTRLMEILSEALDVAGTPLTKRAARALVKGKSEHKDAALELLVGGGYVTIDTGPRGAQLHRSVTRYHAARDKDVPTDAELEALIDPDTGEPGTF